MRSPKLTKQSQAFWHNDAHATAECDGSRGRLLRDLNGPVASSEPPFSWSGVGTYRVLRTRPPWRFAAHTFPLRHAPEVQRQCASRRHTGFTNERSTRVLRAQCR